ncbi:MAG: hypothetical protein H6731_00070 [Myxococcales bacterium]|nr:MAG: hypothetical protein H6731_00070 [Myxococcales bacterium]
MKNNEQLNLFFKGLFTNLVAGGRVDLLEDYFYPDAKINLNGKELSYDEFKKRIMWMKERDLKVTFVDYLADDNKAFCKHFSEINENGQISCFKVLSHMKLKDKRVQEFEHVTLKVSGTASENVVNDF